MIEIKLSGEDRENVDRAIQTAKEVAKQINNPELYNKYTVLQGVINEQMCEQIVW
jgi:hypothetical protein